MIYTYEDCYKLAEILEKYDDTIITINWTGSITNDWAERDPAEIIDLIIRTFIISYNSDKKVNYNILDNLIYNLPFSKIFLEPGNISLKKAKGVLNIFKEWRLSINK